MYKIFSGIHVLLFLYIVSCNGEYNNEFQPYTKKFSSYYTMTTAKALTHDEMSEFVEPLVETKGWIKELVKNMTRIRKDFHFRSFQGAFSFMTQIAMLAEKLSHFPEWFNVYRVVKITLCTKHIKTLCMKDIEIAHFADRVHDAQKDI